MNKTRSSNKKTQQKGMTLGLSAFEKISAVEGIRLTNEMKRDLINLDAQQMTSAERTRFINNKYGKKSA